MVRESHLTGIVRPTVDERQLDQETSRMSETMDEAADLTPDIDARNLRRQLKRAIPGGGLLGSAADRLLGRGGGGEADTGDDVGAQQASVDLDDERNDILEDILDELEGTGASQTRGGGGGGGMSAGAGGAAGLMGPGGAIALASVLGGALVGGSRILDRDAAETQEDRAGDLVGGGPIERIEAAIGFAEDPLGSGSGLAPLFDGIDWSKWGPKLASGFADRAGDKLGNFDWPSLPDLSGLNWPEIPDLSSLDWPDLPALTGLNWPGLPDLSSLDWPDPPSLTGLDWPGLPDLSSLDWPSLPDLSSIDWPDPPGWLTNLPDAIFGGGDSTADEPSDSGDSNSSSGSSRDRSRASANSSQSNQVTVNVGGVDASTDLSRQQRQKIIDETMKQLERRIR